MGLRIVNLRLPIADLFYRQTYNRKSAIANRQSRESAFVMTNFLVQKAAHARKQFLVNVRMRSDILALRAIRKTASQSNRRIRIGLRDTRKIETIIDPGIRGLTRNRCFAQ